MPAKTPTRANNSKNKKSFFAKSFNLRNRKVQMFISVFVIAVVGGGYLVIKSFAASWTYTRAGGNLVANQNYDINPCKVSPYNEPAKNNAPVWSMACPTSPTATAWSQLVSIVGAQLPAGWGGQYQVCARIKGGGTFKVGGNVLSSYDSSGKYPDKEAKYEINNQNYVDYCSPRFPIYNANTTNYFSGFVRMDSATKYSKGGGWINISQITLTKVL